MIREWYKHTSYNIGDSVSDSIAAFAMGSCEQHSHYLPVGTDGLIGERLLFESAKKAKANVFVLPAINYGYSPHHKKFPGYITLNQNTIKELIKDICISLYDNGIKKILIINSHGGNQSILQSAVNELGESHEQSPVLMRYWDIISDEVKELRTSEPGGMGHAGEFETSLMKYLYPELVIEDCIDDREVAKGSVWHHPDMFAKNKVYIYKSFDKYSQYGNIGQPQFGTKEKGQLIADLVTTRIAEFMDFFSQNDM